MIYLIKYCREIAIIVLAIVCFSSVRSCQNKASDNEVLSHVNDSVFSVALYYKSKHGEAIGQIKTHELTINQWEKYGNQLGFNVKELEKQVWNAKMLVAHWKGRAQMKDTAFITLRDTIYNRVFTGKVFEWNNNHLFLTGFMDSTNLALTYQYQTNFTITPYYKKQGLFKKPQLVTDIWFEDPNMRVQEFRGFVIQEPKKKLIQTGGFKIVVGIGIGYAAAKFL